MKPVHTIRRHVSSRAFWAGFFSVFSFDITGRTQAHMMRDALGYEPAPRTTREVLERTDAEALEADREALRRDWDTIAKDFPATYKNPFDAR